MMKTYLKRAFQLSDSGVKGLAKSIWSFFLYFFVKEQVRSSQQAAERGTLLVVISNLE